VNGLFESIIRNSTSKQNNAEKKWISIDRKANLSAARFGDLQNRISAQVRIHRGSGSDQKCLVGHLHVHGVLVDLRVYLIKNI
jgi:hypothetical protein